VQLSMFVIFIMSTTLYIACTWCISCFHNVCYGLLFADTLYYRSHIRHRPWADI